MQAQRTLPDVYSAEAIPDEARAEIDALLQSGDLFRYTRPEDAPVSLLEAEFAALLGSKYALAVSSCSAALFLSLKALDLPKGAKVLIPAFTFAAVPSAVVHADCVPVLAEVDDSLRLDMADFAAKLTPDIGAILISHMRGHTSDMDQIMDLAKAADVSVIEDAAHSLGTTWNGKNIGTIGDIGCFSFQSYKLVNAGEGGILVTDNADLVARAIIMSGAYEETWRKHPGLTEACSKWQNKLPLYNLRMHNLSAAVIRPQLPHVARRSKDGLRNHDHLAARLGATGLLVVPPALQPERRAPDSLQFLLPGDEAASRNFEAEASRLGVKVQIFGLSTGNARAYWNWEFLGDVPDLPKTRAMLMRTADVRLPARLSVEDCDVIADVLIEAARNTLSRVAA